MLPRLSDQCFRIVTKSGRCETEISSRRRLEQFLVHRADLDAVIDAITNLLLACSCIYNPVENDVLLAYDEELLDGESR